MGKPKPKRFQKAKQVSALGSDDEDLYKDLNDPDPNSNGFIYNEIDEFHNRREQIPLDSEDEGDLPFRKTIEEVLPLSDDSDDDDDDVDAFYGNDYYSRMAKKEEIASDIEDDNEEDDLPNDKAWGRKFGAYYNTDYVDKDYDGIQGSDAEIAEAEENEATKIQKRILKELSEEDFGFDWIVGADKSESQPREQDQLKVVTNLSALTEKEKIELLKKESPELLCVVKDFLLRMQELKEKILPLISLVVCGQIPPGPGADYLLVKRQLIYQYCTNISFYMLLRCKDVNVKHHPVVKRLLTFRKLLQKLEPIENRLEPDIQAVLKMIELGQEIKPLETTSQPSVETSKRKSKKPGKTKDKKRVTFSEEIDTEPTKPKKLTQMETPDEKEALKMYNIMKQNKLKRKLVENSEEEEEIDSEEKEEEEDDEDMLDSLGNENSEPNDEKREISYQIAKNKGLTPHRKKEYRNPRVRHRVKFQKAKVRRKGQFKQPRTELQRYGGEVSGIRIGSKRGIKLK